MFSRESAFSLEVRDPDNLEDNSRIVEMYSIGGELLVFKTTGIYRMLTAETTDPNRNYPDTRHSYEKLYSIGSTSPYVARVILQFKEILAAAISDSQRKQKIINHVWQANKLLLSCESALYQIYQQSMELMLECDKIIELHKANQSIPAIPKINNLDDLISQFFDNGKKFLIASYQLLNEFFAMPFSDHIQSHFDKHQKWIKNKLGEENSIYKVLKQDESWIRVIAESRNAIQHAKEGQRVEIENVSIKPGNKFSSPGWKYDLAAKKAGKQEHFSDIAADFSVFLENMLTFFEELLLLCIENEIKDNVILTIYKREPEDIQPDCPVVYGITIKSSK
jgi:hypothetical protein